MIGSCSVLAAYSLSNVFALDTQERLVYAGSHRHW